MLAYNNPKKMDSRELIVKVIKEYLPEEKVKMFELIGGGVGAQYYADNLDIEFMALVERDKSLYEKFSLCTLMGKIDAASKYNCSVQKFFKTIYPKDKEYGKQFFNVVNLDFCSWFYDNDKPTSTGQIIDRMFKSNALCNNGLLFCTFQVDGFNLRRYRSATGADVPITANEILLHITYLAMQNGYKIKDNKIIFENLYRSTEGRGAQTMLNIAFQVTK